MRSRISASQACCPVSLAGGVAGVGGPAGGAVPSGWRGDRPKTYSRPLDLR